MKSGVILDTGPLVAYLEARDRYHKWTVAEWGRCTPPLLTCEAVVVEACFLIAREHGSAEAVLGLIAKGGVSLAFRLSDETQTVAALMRRYGDVGMSLADACLVRMAEQHSNSHILTIDRHFKIYRKNGREVIPTLMPPAGHTPGDQAAHQ